MYVLYSQIQLVSATTMCQIYYLFSWIIGKNIRSVVPCWIHCAFNICLYSTVQYCLCLGLALSNMIWEQPDDLLPMSSLVKEKSNEDSINTHRINLTSFAFASDCIQCVCVRVCMRVCISLSQFRFEWRGWEVRINQICFKHWEQNVFSLWMPKFIYCTYHNLL